MKKGKGKGKGKGEKYKPMAVATYKRFESEIVGSIKQKVFPMHSIAVPMVIPKILQSFLQTS